MSTIDISVDGIEVIQCIQTAANDIRLIYGKRTFVRAYLKAASLPADQFVTGTLSCRHEGVSVDVNCSSPMRFRVDHDKRASRRQRWSESLNFELPESFWETFALTEDDSLTVEFSMKLLTNSESSVILDRNSTSTTVRFDRSPEFFCKTVGFRVHHPNLGGHLEPSPADIRTIQEYVEATFPVARAQCHWNSITVETAPSFEALQENLDYTRENNETVERQLSNLLCQLLAIRNEDVLAGQDPRTLYIGVLPDPTARYGGIAMDSPDLAAPHVVSLCSVEASGELAAHELAHVLGRHHPGVPDVRAVGRPLGQNDEYHNETADPDAAADESEQTPSRPPNETELDPNGYIAVMRKPPKNKNDLDGTDASNDQYDPNDQYDQNNGVMGLDARRSVSQPDILLGRQYFDLMTYRFPKWVSGHTYEGLYQRLREFDQFAPAEQIDDATTDNLWTIIARYDLSEHSGVIEHVLKTNYRAPEVPTESTPASSSSNSFPTSIQAGSNEEPELDLRPTIQFEWDDRRDNEATTEPAADSDKGDVKPVIQEDRPVSIFFPNSEHSDLSQQFGLIHHTVHAPNKNDNDGLLEYVKLRINDVAISQFSNNREQADVNASNGSVSAFKAITESIHKSLRAELPDAPNADGKANKSDDDESQEPRIAGVDDAELITNFTYDDEPRLLESGIRLTWSASTGQPYFHFNWPRLRERVTTTVQCKRQPAKWHSDDAAANAGEAMWETIAVTNDQSGRIWIDPRFFGYPGHGDYSHISSASISLDERLQHGLTLRVFAHIGFERVCVFNNIDIIDDKNGDVLATDLKHQELHRPVNDVHPETVDPDKSDNGLLNPIVRHTESWLAEKRDNSVVMPLKFTAPPESEAITMAEESVAESVVESIAEPFSKETAEKRYELDR